MDSHRIRTIGNYFESYTPTTGGGAADAGFDECGMALPVPEEVLALASQAGAGVPFRILGIPDEHTVTGSQADIFRHYGLSMEGIAAAASQLLGVTR